MRFKTGFNSISVAFGIFVLLILAKICYLNTKSVCDYRPCLESVDKSQNYVETILNMTRLKIKLEMWNYNFTNSGVDKLEDLLMESGGMPVRSLIVSTWRSGSSFLGDLLNAIPSNFYHYEPLIKYKSNQIRKQSHIIKAIRMLKNLLKCNYSDMKDYYNVGKTVKFEYFSYNTRLWENCRHRKDLCSDANFTASFCKLFPFQNMKVVKFRLRFVENILEDRELNVKVVLLIRDPRAVMQSRKRVTFCQSPDCSNPEVLCTDMISDYMAANKLLQKYPDRLMLLRFEDLALNLNATTDQLLKFLRLERNQSIEEFLLTHTKVEKGDAFSRFRVSKNVVFKWKTLLDFKDVLKIQEVCKEAMDLWGYQLADNVSHIASADFHPLKPYSMNLTERDNH